MRGCGLAVAGIDFIKKALENGQVETLLLDPQPGILDQDMRSELIRLAQTSGAAVLMIEDNEQLAAIQGVGGLLRYKLEDGKILKEAWSKRY